MATLSRITEAIYRGRFDDQMSQGAAAAQRSMKQLGATVVETDQAVTRATRTAESWVRSADPMTAAAMGRQPAVISRSALHEAQIIRMLREPQGSVFLPPSA